MLDVDAIDLLASPPDTKKELLYFVEPVKNTKELLIDEVEENTVKSIKDDEIVISHLFMVAMVE